MENNNAPIKSTQAGRIKAVLFSLLAFLILMALLALYMYLPQLEAKKDAERIYEIIYTGNYDYIVLNETRPFTSGSLEQLLYDFELKLDGDDESRFTEAFLSDCKEPSFKGYSLQKNGFWDMKVSVFSGDERFIFYVYSDGIYVTDKYRRFNFECGTKLFELVTAIKEAQYQN